jgi:hypothetical protein
LDIAGLNFGAMKTDGAGKKENLVGKYFHSANENNKIEWQGVVIGEPQPGWYLVQLFEWASGEPTVQRLVPIEKMIGWLFYADADAMMVGSKC